MSLHTLEVSCYCGGRKTKARHASHSSHDQGLCYLESPVTDTGSPILFLFFFLPGSPWFLFPTVCPSNSRPDEDIKINDPDHATQHGADKVLCLDIPEKMEEVTINQPMASASRPGLPPWKPQLSNPNLCFWYLCNLETARAP